MLLKVLLPAKVCVPVVTIPLTLTLAVGKLLHFASPSVELFLISTCPAVPPVGSEGPVVPSDGGEGLSLPLSTKNNYPLNPVSGREVP